MALQTLANGLGVLLSPNHGLMDYVRTMSSRTVDAAGESCTFIGRMFFAAGPGTSKTLSTGTIYFRTGAVTFANVGTTVQVGVQDVGATGLEDGVFDVSKTLTGGGGGITANAMQAIVMNSGTKTIAHGDLVAVSIEMTARGGVADSVIVQTIAGASAGMPYLSVDTGSGPTKSAFLPNVTIAFDDGTIGWLGGASFACSLEQSGAFGSGSTPDEHGLIFQVPFKCALVGISFDISSFVATDDFDIVLYSDPTGTPSAVTNGTISVDADLTVASTGILHFSFPASLPLLANTDYCIAIKPTTTNTIAYTRMNFGTSNGVLRKPTMLGTNWSLGTRTDATGAFAPDTTILPMFGLWIDQLSDDSGGIGGRVIGGGF